MSDKPDLQDERRALLETRVHLHEVAYSLEHIAGTTPIGEAAHTLQRGLISLCDIVGNLADQVGRLAGLQPSADTKPKRLAPVPDKPGRRGRKIRF